ncbi:hypothetical protein D3C72_1088740 [compost metagenome]
MITRGFRPLVRAINQVIKVFGHLVVRVPDGHQKLPGTGFIALPRKLEQFEVILCIHLQAGVERAQTALVFIAGQQLSIGLHLLPDLLQPPGSFVLVGLHVFFADRKNVLHRSHPIAIQRGISGTQRTDALEPVVLDLDRLILNLVNLPQRKYPQSNAQRSNDEEPENHSTGD